MTTESLLKIGNVVIDCDNYSLSGCPRCYLELQATSYKKRPDAIARLAKFWEELTSGTNSCQLFSNLHTFDDVSKLCLDQQLNSFERTALSALEENALLATYSHYLDVPLPEERSAVQADMMYKIIYTVMNTDCVKGHVFFALDQDCVAYPHEDLGFGFFIKEREIDFENLIKSSMRRVGLAARLVWI